MKSRHNVYMSRALMRNSNNPGALFRLTLRPQSLDERGDLVPSLARDEKLAILHFQGVQIEMRGAFIHRHDQPRDTGWNMQRARSAVDGFKRDPGELELLAHVCGDLELALFE
jgi:hypothetical protein